MRHENQFLRPWPRPRFISSHLQSPISISHISATSFKTTFHHFKNFSIQLSTSHFSSSSSLCKNPQARKTRVTLFSQRQHTFDKQKCPPRWELFYKKVQAHPRLNMPIFNLSEFISHSWLWLADTYSLNHLSTWFHFCHTYDNCGVGGERTLWLSDQLGPNWSCPIITDLL